MFASQTRIDIISNLSSGKYIRFEDNENILSSASVSHFTKANISTINKII